jgi:hypothetical protein
MAELSIGRPILGGQVHRAAKFGNPFDPHTVIGRTRAAQRAGRVGRVQTELETLRATEQS